jgi:hypothetical protein
MNDTSFLNNFKAITNNLINCMNSINSFNAEYNALDKGNTISEDALAELGITKTDFTTAVSSFLAFKSLFETGHNTNLYKVK